MFSTCVHNLIPFNATVQLTILEPVYEMLAGWLFQEEFKLLFSVTVMLPILVTIYLGYRTNKHKKHSGAMAKCARKYMMGLYSNSPALILVKLMF